MIQPDRTQAPPFLLSSDFRLTQPEIFRFSGGQKLYAFRGLQQTAVKLDFIFQAGKWHESLLGVSHFTAHMLPRGTETRNSFQLASALDHLGADVHLVAGYDHVIVSLSVLEKNLAASLRLVHEMLTKPSFDETEFRQEKEIFLQNLEVSNQKPSVLASKAIRRTLFGAGHPYGNSPEKEDVTQITTRDLRSFFAEHFHLHAAYVVGRITEEDVGLITGAFIQPFVQVPDPAHVRPEAGVSHRIEKPGSVQASIRMGMKCLPKRDDPFYFDAVVFNLLLGGYFGSRLMKNIREEKGLTYGIHSSMNHFIRDSFWAISAEVNQQHAAQAITEIRKEIRVLQDILIPEEELDLARNYFIGSWQSDNNTLFAVADKIRNIHWFGLPDDYYDRLLGHIRAITPERIQEIGNSHFDTKDLVEIQVG
ncbi:MAG: pitrilysin family protein [Cytophagales bacterium]|nr:pitrilysin family protein [Cytophagales bacterium]